MPELEAPALGEPLPVEFANTIFVVRGELMDGLASPAQLGAWLARHADELGAVPARGAGEHLAAVRELRADTRELLDRLVAGGRPSPALVRRLNVRSEASPRYPALQWPPRGAPVVLDRALNSDPWRRIVAELARSVIRLAGGPKHELIRRCPAPGCVLYFVQDHPRREWCSVACGNRVRVARHYRRHRGAHAGV
jgi:predicted RNA-binding Zn ribbon-like protein